MLSEAALHLKIRDVFGVMLVLTLAHLSRVGLVCAEGVDVNISYSSSRNGDQGWRGNEAEASLAINPLNERNIVLFGHGTEYFMNFIQSFDSHDGRLAPRKLVQ